MLFSDRRKISDVIEDSETPESTRTKLLETREIISFARDKGLNVEDSYQYYIETPSSVVSYLVQAAYPYRLEFKTWWFPIVGSVPYLGFYEKSERDELALSLESEGFDVRRGAAGAFSSLGWFQDPIFSSMLRRSEQSLAHLLFHELTHRTIWIPNSPEFNENLAEFIAYILTRNYLLSRSQQQALIQYEELMRDKELFQSWLLELKRELKELYDDDIDNTNKMFKKKIIFNHFTKGPRKPQFKRYDFVGEADTWNNAVVLSSSLYTPDFKRFSGVFSCFEKGLDPVARFIKSLKKQIELTSDPDKSLAQLCLTTEHPKLPTKGTQL